MFIILKGSRFTRNHHRRAQKRRNKTINAPETPLALHTDEWGQEHNCGEVNPHHDVKHGKQKDFVKVSQDHHIPTTRVMKSDPIWSDCAGETQTFDKEMLEGWSNSMDVLLVFAALFSSILSTFLVEAHKDLKQSPTDLTNKHLATLVQRLDYIITNASALHPQIYSESNEFIPSSRNVRVNFCWFTSLTCSLFAAGGAILAKEWFREYSRGLTEGSSYDQSQFRHRRFEGLKTWKFQEVVEFLPTLMHISIYLFFIGLIDFLWELYRPISIFVMLLFLVMGVAVLFMGITSTYTSSCPYRTFITGNTLHTIMTWTVLALLSGLSKPFAQPGSTISFRRTFPRKPDPSTSDDMEPLLWLLGNSTNQETVVKLLKMAPVFLTTLRRRTQLIHTGAIDKLTRLIALSQMQDQASLKIDAEEVSYYVALRSVLTTPIPTSSTGREDMSAWLNLLAPQHTASGRREEANSAMLAMSLALSVGDLASLYGPAKQVVHCREVALWARVVFLDAASRSVGKSHNRKLALDVVLDLADSTPPHHITCQFLGTFSTTLIAVFGGNSIPSDCATNKTALAQVGDLLCRCLESMIRTINSQRAVVAPLQDSIHPSQGDRVIAVIWRMVKMLEFEKELEWDILVDKLITYNLVTHKQLSGPALDVVLEFSERYTSFANDVLVKLPMEQRVSLLKACLINPDVLSSKEVHGRISCASAVIACKRGPTNPSATLFQTLLADVDKLYGMIAWCALECTEPGWKESGYAESFRLVSAICEVEDVSPGTDVHRHVDQLAERGILVEFLKLLQHAAAPGKEVTSGVWCSLKALARCANAKWFTGKNSSLKDLAALSTSNQYKNQLLVEGWTTLAIFMMWNTAFTGYNEAGRAGLLMELIGSGILPSLSRLVEWMALIDSRNYPGLHEECLNALCKLLGELAVPVHELAAVQNPQDPIVERYDEFLRGLLSGLNKQSSSVKPTRALATRREELRGLTIGRLREAEGFCGGAHRGGGPGI